MKERFFKNLNKYRVVILISIFLFIIPFFWFKPNEMDLGGDSSRLYFYDPLSYIENGILYPLLGNTIGEIQYGAYSPLPHILLLLFLKALLGSSTLLIMLFNSIKLSVGFLAIYAILKEIIPKSTFELQQDNLIEISAILGGLFYILSRFMVDNYNIALIYHNQIFLNPLMFYLLLKYFLTLRKEYLWISLFLSFLFAPNFALISAPAFFSFYILAIVFLLLYVRLIKRKKLYTREIFGAIFIFVGLNAFHVIPQVFDVFTPGSPIHTTVFNQQVTTLRDHFHGILGISQPAINIFLPSWTQELKIVSFIIPFIIVVGFLFNKYGNKIMSLTGFSFLITYFLLTGKITWVGQEFYSYFFYIPGFAMFRNFNGVFVYVYSFFYALLFGQALFLIFSRLKPINIKIFSSILGILIVVSSWQFINGNLVNRKLNGTTNVKSFMVMDPKYEETLTFLRNFNSNSRILTLPFTDSSQQVVHGLNDGAYIGPSTIAFLTGKNDLDGYALISPYSLSLWELSKEKNFDEIKKLLGLLDVQYIFYNNDPLVYDNTFPDYPYSPIYGRKYMPKNQEEYKEYVAFLTKKKIFEKGTFNFYKLDDKFFLPRFYIPHRTILYKDSSSLDMYAKAKSFLSLQDTSKEPRVMYIEKETCSNSALEKICTQNASQRNLPKIKFEKINSVRYKVTVSGATEPYTLVFLNQYHQHWELVDVKKDKQTLWAQGERIVGSLLGRIVAFFSKEPSDDHAVIASYFNGDISEGNSINTFLFPAIFITWGKEIIAENKHFQVNGYANAWYIDPNDMQNREDYELIVEVRGQKVFFISLVISCVSLMGFLLWGIKLFLLKRRNAARSS